MSTTLSGIARCAFLALFFIASAAFAGKSDRPWPIIKHYDQKHLSQIALPIGGIGTGTISLGGRGDGKDWEIVTRPAKGFNPGSPFFAIRVKPAGGSTKVRAL